MEFIGILPRVFIALKQHNAKNQEREAKKKKKLRFSGQTALETLARMEEFDASTPADDPLQTRVVVGISS